MKEKLETINFKYKVSLFTFLFFLFIGALSPISGADWKSYIIGKEGFIECFKNINISDGRIVSGFLINFFSYNKILFDICFALLMSGFVKICNNIMGTSKNKYYFLYPLIGVLLVSTFMFSYNYTSITSTVAYTFPAIMFFFYFYNFLKDEMTKIDYVKQILLIVFISLSSIHLAITFFITNLVFLAFNSKYNKKIKNLILLIINFILVIVSLTTIKNSLFYTEINDITGNISYMIENVFSKNIVLIIIGAIPINYYLSEKLKENTYGRVVITVFNLILFFSLSYNFFNYSPVNLNLILSKYSGIFATENWYYIFYYIIYMVLFVISMNHFIKSKRTKLMLNMFSVASLILIILTIISPLFDLGNIVFICFTIIIIACLLAKEINTRVYVKIVKLALTLLVFYYISMFGVIKYIDVTRTNYIKEQIDAKDTRIEVKANPIYLVWRYNPDYFQSNDFKKYYEIPNNYTIEVKYFGIFEKIEKKVKE